jgi:catechol-2,3-dioxygenase
MTLTEVRALHEARRPHHREVFNYHTSLTPEAIKDITNYLVYAIESGSPSVRWDTQLILQFLEALEKAKTTSTP